MSSGEEYNNLIDPEKDKNIEWDNGDPTYGHAINPSSIKRKDAPDEDHLKSAGDVEGSKIIGDLKNSTLSSDTDIGNRNNDQDKGIGGKSL